MPQTQWMAVLLLILSLTVHTVKSDSRVIVRPTDSDPSICGGHAVCDTLSNLISSKHALLSDSDLELEFLRGTHNITVSVKEFKLENKTNVTWYGQDAVIVCERNFMFKLVEIERLVIKDLKFSRCGNIMSPSLSRAEQLTLMQKAALYVENISFLHFEAVTVVNSTGYELFGLNLLRKALLCSCQFIDNNRACSMDNKHHCIGGNIALWFSSISNSSQISINDSVIKGGSDSSGQLSSNQTNFFSLLRANGLAVVLHHTEYLVELSINNCSFMKNTGNSKHPAVLVYDNAGLKNRLTVFGSTFKEEGTVVISSIGNSLCNKTGNCYTASEGKYDRTHFVEIINCTFLDGTQSSLEINVSPTYVRYKRLSMITFKNSHFQNFSTYENLSDQAVVKITYNFLEVKYPALLIEVQECVFSFNKILSVLVHLEKDAYLPDAKPWKKNCNKDPIVTLRNTSFTDNKHSVMLIAVKNRTLPFWQSPIDKNKQIISIVDVVHCSFTNNSVQSGEGIFVVRKSYIGLKNSSFSFSSGTALYAENSVIRIEGQNVFEGNTGDFGGAMNLNQSLLFLMATSHINITNNSAYNQGGGIFAIAYGIEMKECCKKETSKPFYHYLCTINKHEKAVDTELIRHTSNEASSGSSIFGGQYSNCIGLYDVINCTLTLEGNRQPIPSFINYSSDISSPATKLCLCDNNSVPTDQCSNISKEAFPGQDFQISIVAIGELHQKTSAVVTAKIHKERNLDYRNVSIGSGHLFQVIENNKCTNFSYKVKSDLEQETLELAIDESGFPPKIHQSDTKIIQLFRVQVSLKNCSKGFELFKKTKGAPKCKCENILNKNSNIECNINKGITIKREYVDWTN